MKNNYNQRKIDKHLDYIDQQYEDYLKELDQNDKEVNAKKKQTWIVGGANMSDSKNN